MKLLALDVGSSSVKAAVLRDRRVTTKIARIPFPTRCIGVRVEVAPAAILKAVADAVADLGTAVQSVDAVALSVMSPAWVAMDSSGRPLTPIVTHQDRRAVEVALELERKVGRRRFLHLAGNRPVPGGISATTWAWYLHHEPQRLRRADLVGHLNTFLHRRMTGARVIDPSNASFTGLYSTVTQTGWNPALCDAVGISEKLLPEILEADQIAGRITAPAARRFGLTAGLPMLTGIVDTSSAMLLAGARAGQLINNCGSTDVLGLCMNRARPHERLLTRALGVGRKWMSVSTLAAAGSSLLWMRGLCFADLSPARFWRLTDRLAAESDAPEDGVEFDPRLAGERTSVEQSRGAFLGLTLSTTREQMLRAVIDALARAGAARLDLLRQLGQPMRRRVVLTGGSPTLTRLLHRDWHGRWTFHTETEATLRGLALLEPQER